ncbi:SMP-30/gluconolactonase/LRE family protein [Emticicia sp. BO119]|uniref:SMP-30/gluconolactonase/LRE family protein n=1 Tax=Emticicia sp. BO119 TaxID=2757768 RepID=UPI0015F08827|nr:SMP-30/gluconolactonase/LRE family protein [Emticicia sp. BO119]MBA4852126.1 SMP-30/gluconolactonase/LRE family protein [Emticicia sp. BO119]
MHILLSTFEKELYFLFQPKLSQPMQNLLLFLLLFLTIISCRTQSDSQTVNLTFEKDLIPEGIAVDARSGKLFLSSLRKNKIVTSEIDGRNATDFIESNQYDYQSGFGMTIKGDTLYALSNSLQKQNNTSVLLLLNTKTRQLIARYKTDIAPYGYLNDLAVSASNQIFVTDSESNKIYLIKRPDKNIEVYLDTVAVGHSNGIAISDDNTRLYLASVNGIRVVDVQTKKILNQPDKASAGIDGMKFYRNSLIGMVEKGLMRYFLNEDGTKIVGIKELIHFDATFQSPTTFDIVGDTVYFIKNVQLANFNDHTNEVIDTRKLESLVLLKYKIED